MNAHKMAAAIMIAASTSFSPLYGSDPTKTGSDLGRRPNMFSAEAVMAKHQGLALQALVDKIEWKWSDDAASRSYCVRSFEGAYRPILDISKRRSDSIGFFSGGTKAYSFLAHEHTVFVGRFDVVYYAALSDCLSGCNVVAYDLRNSKQLWSTSLWAIPITREAMQYRNRINMEIKDNRLTIYGNEAYGKYIEILDLKTGKTLGHKAMPDPKYFP